ncbi:MAG: hypothetical protein ACLFXM_05125 [Acidimicrobiia bacterium]
MSTTPGPSDRPPAEQQGGVPLPPESRADEPPAAQASPADEAARDAEAARDRREAERDETERERAAGGAGAGAASLPSTAQVGQSAGLLRIVAIIVIVGGIISMVAGVATWLLVREQLQDENITVSDDADRFEGWEVDGPFTAYEQANVIERHALEETGGLTYAELDRGDPLREQAMQASFLRASLFTSVVSFGVAAFAFGLGILLILVGVGLMRIARALNVAVTA